MARTYKNKYQRQEIFMLLDSFLNSDMSLNDGKRLVLLFTEFNPYTYTKTPHVYFQNFDKVSTNAYYQHSSKKIVFNISRLNDRISHQKTRESKSSSNLTNEEICAVDLLSLLNTIGHEMKHFLQHKAVDDYKFDQKNNYDTYIRKLYNDFYKSNALYVPNNLKVSVTLKFLNSNILDKYFDCLTKDQIDELEDACYLDSFPETDARKSGTNFANGMINTLCKDPISNEYPKVKNMLLIARDLSNDVVEKDMRKEDLLIGQEFSNHLIDVLLKKEIPTSSINKLGLLELNCINSMICLNNNTEKLQRLINEYKSTSNNFAETLYLSVTNKYPDKKFYLYTKPNDEIVDNNENIC